MGNCLDSSARVGNRESTFGGKNQNHTSLLEFRLLRIMMDI